MIWEETPEYTNFNQALKEKNQVYKLNLAKITKIPPQLALLKNLKQLTIRQSHLKNLPIEIKSLVNLEYLYVSDNQLVELPKWLGELTNIKELNLANNQIKTLPPSLEKLVKLEKINLVANQIKDISLLSGLKNLVESEVRENPIPNLQFKTV